MTTSSASQFRDLADATILSTRFISFSGLFIVLGCCVYFKSFVVLYSVFTFPGMHEFISMANLTSATTVGTISIMLAYIYNIALVASISLVVSHNLYNFPNEQAELVFQEDLYNCTFVYLLCQIPLFLFHHCTSTAALATNTPAHAPTFKSLGLVALGSLWCPGLTFFSPLIAARTGISFLAFLFTVVGLQDNWQLIFGKLFGKHRPFPYLSPKKSIEGYVGGTIMTVLSIWFMKKYFAYDWVLFSIIVVVLGILGDLSMSYVKRALSLKDTGDVLPGVGGLLDRMDSAYLILPATYWLMLRSIDSESVQL